MTAVTSRREGPVTIITLSRPQARNAVDGPTARALAEAFEAFDADPAGTVEAYRERLKEAAEKKKK